MDIGTATALTRYTYQTAIAQGGQGQNAAVLQAVQSSYASLAGNPLAGGALAPLASGMQALGGDSGSADFLALAGGADASAAASLFSASSGFDAAAGMNGTLALTAYANRQEGLPSGTARSAASAINAEPASSAVVQDAIQAARSALSATTLNLLA